MKVSLFLIFLAFNSFTLAKLNVLSTTPDLAWLIKSIGGERVQVESLLDGSEDPHYVDAMPSWIAKASKADIFCKVGLELEVGWVPKILSRSRNSKIQRNGKGFCDIGKYIKALEIPKQKIDRSMGDVHASGNPHYQLGPSRFKQAANGVFEILVNSDQAGAAVYAKNLEKTLKSIEQTHVKAKNILEKSKSWPLMSYHKEFSYFFEDFKLSFVGEIEEIPGVPPSAGRIARMAIFAKQNKVRLVLANTASSYKILNKFKEISGVSYKQIPVSMRKGGTPSNYDELIVGLARAIVEGP